MTDKNRYRRDAYGLSNPLQTLNSLPVIASRNPTANDRQYAIGTLWINEDTNSVYSLTSVLAGVASWPQLSSGTSGPEIETLTGNSGGAVGPDGLFNVDFVGSGDITVTGNPGTNTLTISDTSPANAETLTADVGGAVGPDGANNINIVSGSGITTSGNPGTNTITISTTSVVTTWTRIAGTTQAMAIDNGYIPTNAALTTFTLPATAAVGDYVEVCGEGTNGWTIAQNAGQSIQYGNVVTTTGVGGSLSSTNQYDTVRIICRQTDNVWSVLSSVGTLNAV